MGLLFPYSIEDKERWTDLLDMCLVPPALNVNIIFEPVSFVFYHKKF